MAGEKQLSVINIELVLVVVELNRNNCIHVDAYISIFKKNGSSQ